MDEEPEKTSKEYTYTIKQYADYLFAHIEGNEEYVNALGLIESMQKWSKWL